MPDVLVVCGTPQVTDGSVPFRRLQQALAAAEARVPVRLNIGAGLLLPEGLRPGRGGQPMPPSRRG